MSFTQSSREAIERENLERLHNALRVARETEQVGAETCLELQNQTEQIYRIAEKTQNINHNLQQSKRVVRGMSGFIGRVKNWFSKPPKEPEPLVKSSPSARRHTEGSKISTLSDNISSPSTSNSFASHSSQETKKQAMRAYYTPEEEQILDELDKHVTVIKDMAYNIGDTLDHHNQVLDLISVQTDKNTRDMRTIEGRMRRLM